MKTKQYKPKAITTIQHNEDQSLNHNSVALELEHLKLQNSRDWQYKMEHLYGHLLPDESHDIHSFVIVHGGVWQHDQKSLI